MTEQQQPPQPEKSKSVPNGSGFAIGMALGVVLGIALDNVGVGIALGVVFGAAFNAAQKKNSITGKND
jgi:F0F1-type ATP synthase membrane subunit c/vacuolar-type H+-ATPase subunit K